ncbi:MAG: hypothetical protein KR126chlam2_00376 [Chlamydiae bacterium]|nr:hypothetical protein [Chlamydiota bacterium]
MKILPTYPTNEAQEIDEALNILELTIRLETGFRYEFINHKCFESNMEINKNTNSIFNDNYHAGKNPVLKNRFRNLVLTAIGTASSALDKALDKKFGNKNPEDHSQVGSIRNIIYMIRCAFTHDPCNPTWICYEKYQKKPYALTIDKSVSKRIIFAENSSQTLNFEYDFEKLTDTSVNFKHFHALDGFFLLAEYAHTLVSN